MSADNSTVGAPKEIFVEHKKFFGEREDAPENRAFEESKSDRKIVQSERGGMDFDWVE